MNSLVSIIVPVFNAENYLDKCIQSLVNQSYSNIEIILVNDGSTDNSGLICDSFCSVDNRISSFHIENAGVSNARNFGIVHAKGDYISFVDADDWISNNMIGILVDLAVQHNANISICSFSYIDNREMHTTISEKEEVIVLDRHDSLYMAIDRKYYQGFLCNKLFQRDLFFIDGKFCGLNERIFYSEDLEFVTRCIMRCDKVVYTTEKLYYYYQNPDGATREVFNYRKMTMIDAYEKIAKLVPAEFVDIIIKIDNIKVTISLVLLLQYYKSETCDKSTEQKLYSIICRYPLVKYLLSEAMFKHKAAMIVVKIHPRFFSIVSKIITNIIE